MQSQLPKENRWCAFDVEGDSGERGIISIAVYSDECKRYFTDAQEALSCLREHAEAGYRFVAHNAEYDCSVIFWTMRCNLVIVYLNERFNRGEWKYDTDKSPAQIWDTVALSGGLSLAAVGKSIKLPKYPTPQKLLNKDPDKYEWKCDEHETWECIHCYAIRDAQICYEYIRTYTDFLTVYNIKPKRTIGSAATSLWRELDATDSARLTNDIYHVFARNGYYGARVDCFKLGKPIGVYTADVRSMYPSVMLNTPMPEVSNLQFIESRYTPPNVLNYEGMSEAEVYIPDMYIPPLPIGFDGGLYFPVGTVKGIWTHLELRAAITRGCTIKRIYRSLFSTSVCFPFVRFINELYELRQRFKDAGDPRELTVKIILNSLYGRLGMDRTQTEERISLLPSGEGSKEHVGKEIHYIGSTALLRSSKTHPMYSKEGNMLWAATITSAARVKLLEYMELQGGSLLYCDTDSVFSLAPVRGLCDELGGLTDHEEWDKATILAPKLYRLERSTGEKKIRAKGVPKDVAEQFIDVGQVTYETVVRPRDAMNGKHMPGTWVEYKKTRRLSLKKRHPLNPQDTYEDGMFTDTAPIVFGQDELLEDAANPLALSEL